MTPLLEASVALPPRLAETRVHVSAGERIAVIGPNGSGKTTLLRALAGIEGQGAVTVGGEALVAVPPARRPQLISFLPASRDVRWPIPVRDVIALGLATPDPTRVEDLLERLRLGELADRPIDRLSTGERARALLGRALAARPRLLLLDEPLSNLDPAWVLRTLNYLEEVAQDGTAIVMALHDLSQLGRFDRVWMLDAGRLVSEETPGDLLASPRFAEVFEVEPDGTGWTLNPSADRRSSP
ncbi:iron complex transport system ATP-binding protein [Sphingomonas kaistensis]|uniref:Iron complex transport system ATP-binding protein n=1 Tax=Sphingomonas kaistensis TaxID=298708 RepID=A0A7X5Y6U6_9SPHN|nr:ABC transporter ATP-binding protein [Sphingomonas kaistensis]NJC06283.1 iron complex transport system ATP-binding protein [Sphingomonas kaistensis]